MGCPVGAYSSRRAENAALYSVVILVHQLNGKYALFMCCPVVSLPLIYLNVTIIQVIVWGCVQLHCPTGMYRALVH